MEKTYYIDEKVTVWKRNTVIIEGDTEDDCDTKLHNQIKDDTWPNHIIDSEMLFDTEEYMLPIENNNLSTLEVIDTRSGKEKIIYSNDI